MSPNSKGKPMQKRQLGKSDIWVTPVTLGAWAIGGWMWGGQETQDSIAAIHASIDAGVTTIDTAAVYGYGRSEEIVGQAVKGRRDKVVIMTKYDTRWDAHRGELAFEWREADGSVTKIMHDAHPDSVMYECEQSLRRLGTDYIDVYQAHWRDFTTPVEDTMGAIDKLLKQGKIRAAGVSNFSVEDIATASAVVPIASDQPPYSMINRGIEADVLPYCRKNGIGVVVYSPLQRGLLTGKVTMDRQFPEDDHRRTNPFFKPAARKRVLDFLKQLGPIAEEHNATLGQLVINWTMGRDGVTAALVGARDAEQARENAGAAAFEFSAAERKQIDDLLEERFPVGWEQKV